MASTARSWNPRRVHTVRTAARTTTRRLVHDAATLDAGAKTISDRAPADESVSMMCAGTRLGRYVVRRPIGSGGMGTIYEAEHVRLGHRVAIKALHPELLTSGESRKRFEREARSAAKLTGPNVVRVIDVDQTEDGLPFMVMELLSGRDLADEWARRGVPPVQNLVDIAIECLAALAEAHGLGIVHRDVKPENVFLADEGGKTVVKLLDFGIAKLMGECPTGLKTSRCDLYGTPLYMAPEQARLGVVDHRADIFALGTMLYRMLAGRGPFSGDNDARYLRSLLTDPALPLEIAAPGVPFELASVIMKALAIDPRERWQSADELAAALAPFSSRARATRGGEVDVDVDLDEGGSSRETVVVHADARASWGTVLAAPRCDTPSTRRVQVRREDSVTKRESGPYAALRASSAPSAAPPPPAAPPAAPPAPSAAASAAATAPPRVRAVAWVAVALTLVFAGSFTVAATGAASHVERAVAGSAR